VNWLSDRFEVARHGDGVNISSMEGLRGFAVALVFFVHFVALSGPWQPPALRPLLQALEAVGHTGVDLFFVLSGYLIYGALITRPRPFRPYFQRRLQRIYPTFLVVFLIYVVLWFVMPQKARWPSGTIERLGYLAANLLLLPGMLPIEPVVTVAWSLSYEVFYYLALPLAIALLGLRRWQPSSRVCFFALLAFAIVSYSAVWTGPVRLAMFIAGILLYESMVGARVLPVAKPTQVALEKWPRSSEQLSPIYKWTAGGC
jgi:peptidoglycan/LPS O-acetylase OafA/YrhL